MKREDLRELVAIAQADARRELAHLADLRSRIVTDPPEVHVIAALGTYLHNLYGGVENTLKLVATFLNLPLPSGEHWHAQLLNLFLSHALICAELKQNLDDFKGFRHIFRVHYSFKLQWEKMQPLLVLAEPTFNEFYDRMTEIAEK